MVWRICLPTTKKEHLFTGFSERVDSGEKKCTYEEEIGKRF
jgi:hypothetical protein